MRKIKFGMVGAGFMGQRAHLSNFAALPNVEVVALAEPRKELAKRVAEQYHIPRIYASHQELAEDREVEAVAAILPHLSNATVAADLLKAKKHVLVEKPIAGSAHQAEELARLAAENDRIMMVGVMKRYDAGVELAQQRIADWLRTSEMGQPLFVKALCYGGDWICNVDRPLISTGEAPPPPPVSPDPKSWQNEDGPAFLPPSGRQEFQRFTNIFIHNLNLIRYLMPKRFEAVSARIGAKTMAAMLHFGEDTAAVLEGAFVPSHGWQEETRVVFEKGWLDLFTPPPLLINVPARVVIHQMGPQPLVLEPKAPWSWAFRRQAEHFAAAVADYQPGSFTTAVRSPAADALEDMRLAEAIFRADSKYVKEA